jgi:hypothetical protein
MFNADETAFIYSLKKNKIQVVLAQYGIQLVGFTVCI